MRGQDRDLIRGADVLTSDGVDEDEVFKVGDLPPLPALGHVGGFEKLLWRRQRDSSERRKSRSDINEKGARVSGVKVCLRITGEFAEYERERRSLVLRYSTVTQTP